MANSGSLVVRFPVSLAFPEASGLGNLTRSFAGKKSNEKKKENPPPDKSCTNPRVLSHSCWIFSWGWQLRRMLNTADKGRSLETPQYLSTEQ